MIRYYVIVAPCRVVGIFERAEEAMEFASQCQPAVVAAGTMGERDDVDRAWDGRLVRVNRLVELLAR